MKGGRRFSFAALVVVGDEKGRVGYGYGKATEVPLAVEKAKKQAERSQESVHVEGTTIPHRVIGRSGASKVLLMPAPPGTGIIAGATVRAVVESVGVKDILTKSQGSNNPVNLVRATMDGLKRLRSARRGRPLARSGTGMIIDDVHRGIQKNKPRRRVGRGLGSGRGKTCGRGHKGAGSRSGYSHRTGFTGGQTPIFRAIAKRGFNNNAFAPKVFEVNVALLEERFESGETVSPEVLRERGLAKGRFDLVKILGNGDLSKKLTVQAHRFSKSAEEKITKAGGTAERITAATPAPEKKEAE